MAEKFVVLSTKEKKSAEIAKALSSKTARKILDAIADERKSSTDLSKQLKLPLSTIKYNLDLLTEANLIKVSGFKYSEKGREIKYYEPSKKAIIITPADAAKESIISLLSNKLMLTTFIAASAITGFVSGKYVLPLQQTVSLAAEKTEAAGAPAAATFAADIATETTESITTTAVSFNPEMAIITGIFTFGALLILYILYKGVKKK